MNSFINSNWCDLCLSQPPDQALSSLALGLFGLKNHLNAQIKAACLLFIWFMVDVCCLNIFTFSTGCTSHQARRSRVLLLFVLRLGKWFMRFLVFKCYNFPFRLLSHFWVVVRIHKKGEQIENIERWGSCILCIDCRLNTHRHLQNWEHLKYVHCHNWHHTCKQIGTHPMANKPYCAQAAYWRLAVCATVLVLTVVKIAAHMNSSSLTQIRRP